MVKSTEEQIESFFAKEQKKELIPTEAEELEAAEAFKVTHAKSKPKKVVKPVTYSAEEVAAQRPEVKPYNTGSALPLTPSVRPGHVTYYKNSVQDETPEQDTEHELEHQSMEITKKQHVPTWEAGVFDVTVEGITRRQDNDYWHTDEEGNPTRAFYYFVTLKAADGRTIRKRMSDVYSEKSKLGELVMAALGNLPVKFLSDELLGKPVQVVVKLEPNKQGVVWEKVDSFLPSVQFKQGGQSE